MRSVAWRRVSEVPSEKTNTRPGRLPRRWRKRGRLDAGKTTPWRTGGGAVLICGKDRSRRPWSRKADRQTVLRERCPAGSKPDGKEVKIAHAEHSINRVGEVNRRLNQYAL